MNFLLLPGAIYALIELGRAAACGVASRTDFDLCVAEVLHETTLVREGSHTHVVANPHPHRFLAFLGETIAFCLFEFGFVWLNWRLIVAPWRDLDASLFRDPRPPAQQHHNLTRS